MNPELFVFGQDDLSYGNWHELYGTPWKHGRIRVLKNGRCTDYERSKAIAGTKNAKARELDESRYLVWWKEQLMAGKLPDMYSVESCYQVLLAKQNKP